MRMPSSLRIEANTMHIQPIESTSHARPALVVRVAELPSGMSVPFKAVRKPVSHSTRAAQRRNVTWALADSRLRPIPFRRRTRLPQLDAGYTLSANESSARGYHAMRVSARYVAIADRAGAYYHVPPALILAVAAQESSFNPRAVSHSGAEGLMQLMPTTARLLGVHDPFDPSQSIWGGTRFLATLLRHYHGNVRLALAAYNAGMTVVDAEGGRIPAYAETRAYVPDVMGRYVAFVEAADYASGS